MPPRRPPPLLPKSRLVEAINAAPVDTRTRPAKVFDTRVLLSNRAQHEGPALPQPWLVTISGNDTAQTASASSSRQTISCIGGIYMVPDDYDLSELDNNLKVSMQNASRASFVLPSNLFDAQKGSKHGEIPEAHILGQKVFLDKLQSHTKDNSAATLVSQDGKSLLVLEIPPPGADAASVTIEELPRLLQETRVGQMGHPRSELNIIIGAMGRPNLGPLLTGDRSSLDSLERTYSELAFYPNLYWQFAGYLSSLPSSTVSAAVKEVLRGYSGGGDAYKSCKKAIADVFSLVLEAFGEDRIVWGSDLPLDNSDLEKDLTVTAKELWDFNLKLGVDVACDIGLRRGALDKIFGGNAQTFLDKSKAR